MGGDHIRRVGAEAHVTWAPTMRTDECRLSDWLNIGTTEDQSQGQGRRDSPRQATSFWLAAQKDAKTGLTSPEPSFTNTESVSVVPTNSARRP
jgi:hypothetical protein